MVDEFKFPKGLMEQLYPDLIYKINQAFVREWKTYDLGYSTQNGQRTKTAYFTLSFFSSHTRTFHWVSVSDVLWDRDSDVTKKAIEGLIGDLRAWLSEKENQFNTKELENRQDSWKKLLEEAPAGWMNDRSKKLLESAIESSSPIVNNSLPALHRALLEIYSSFHQSPEVNIESMIYRWLQLHHERKVVDQRQMEIILGEAKNYRDDGAQTPPFDWFLPDMDWQSDGSETGLCAWESVRRREESSVTEPSSSGENYKAYGQQELIELFFNRLLAQPSDFGKEIAVRRRFALVPIYDVWFKNIGYGSLKSVVLLFFKQSSDELSVWMEEKFAFLKESLTCIADEIAESALNLALSAPIKPPYELISHFLKVITFIQDWESATVFDGAGLPKYRYKRVGHADGEVKWTWVYESLDGNSFQPSDKTTIQKSMYQHDGTWYMWWTANGHPNLENLWSDDLIPGLGDQEIAEFGHYSILFEFPKTSYIPKGYDCSEARNFIRSFYLRQQLELMRLLIPKVRSRRAALRSAVSAIMARNMSHNIGSHVLARYTTRIREFTGTINDSKADHRSDFLSYLQRRMDFLAEIATSEKAFWSQPLSLNDSLSRLNYDLELARIDDDPKAQPILLSFITGKEDVKASVEFGMPKVTDGKIEVEQADDEWFGCPGGVVGVHGLYVILENVIRNSARHGSGDGCRKLLVHVDKEKSTNDLIQLVILDPETKLEKDGRIPEKTVAEADLEIEKEQVRAGKHSDYGIDGKRKKRYCLHNEINSILNGEPVLDSTGSPNPHYWGVREMQICAHYLRGFALSDLENHLDDKQVFTAEKYKLSEDNHCLAYRLNLLRPKIAAIALNSMDGVCTDDLVHKGIKLIDLSDPLNRKHVSKEAAGFGFLVLENGLNWTECFNGVSLPVRSFEMEKGSISELLEVASVSDNGSEWLDILHRKWAEKCRDKKGKGWRDRSLWGVSVCWQALINNDGVEGPDKLDSGLFRVARTDDSQYSPLPSDENMVAWLNSLRDEGLAAAWLDHDPQPMWDTYGTEFGYAYRGSQHDSKKWMSVEVAFSDSYHTVLLNSSQRGGGWEAIAAAVPRVVVLDERVQAEAANGPRSNLTLSSIWGPMGVWVPEKPNAEGTLLPTCNLEDPNFDALHEFLLNPAYRKEQYPVDFLVLHLTILEKLNKDSGEELLNETLERLIDGTQAQEAEIVIVTGRGVPSIANALSDQKLERARYLPISALLESLVVRPSKLGVMRALWNASRPTDNEKH